MASRPWLTGIVNDAPINDDCIGTSKTQSLGHQLSSPCMIVSEHEHVSFRLPAWTGDW